MSQHSASNVSYCLALSDADSLRFKAHSILLVLSYMRHSRRQVLSEKSETCRKHLTDQKGCLSLLHGDRSSRSVTSFRLFVTDLSVTCRRQVADLLKTAGFKQVLSEIGVMEFGRYSTALSINDMH